MKETSRRREEAPGEGNLKAQRRYLFKGKPQGVEDIFTKENLKAQEGGGRATEGERGKSDSLRDNIILTNSILRLKVHLICVQELKKSIIHRIAELSDFYYAGKQRGKQSHLVDNDFEASLA